MISPNANHSRASADPFKDIHDAGVERHPHAWFMGNQAAISAAQHCDFDVSKPENKLLLSLVVLRVLDRVLPAEGVTKP